MKKFDEILDLTATGIRDVIRSKVDQRRRIGMLLTLLEQLLTAAGREEGLHFTSLFSRIAYFATKLGWSTTFTRAMHQFRIAASSRDDRLSTTEEDVYFNGLFCVATAHAMLAGEEISAEITKLIPDGYPKVVGAGADVRYMRHMRFVATAIVDGKAHLQGFIEENGQQAILDYGDPGRSDLYRQNVSTALEIIGLPLTLSLVDVEVSTSKVLSPRTIVVEPDYLIDVTAVAECYQNDGSEARIHVVRKFLPKSSSPALLLGSIANFFLDELIHDPTLRFEDLLPQMFRLDPVTFSRMNDSQLRELISKARTHFDVLHGVIERQFAQVGIRPEGIFIEPSFYSPVFGIQGRLDLLYTAPEGDPSIVELKSGRPFMANVHGLSSTHYTQTLLYDLMIRAASEFRNKPSNYILYSSQVTQPLRFAPVVQSIQREAIRLRNDIFLQEMKLTAHPAIVNGISTEALPGVKGFMARDVTRFADTFERLRPLVCSYVNAFVTMLGREHFIAKMGERHANRRGGVASIWLESLMSKNENFGILLDLRYNPSDTNDSLRGLISFHRGPETNPLANFRPGDIGVLYPQLEDSFAPILHSQVYKCTVVAITKDTVQVRLRNSQVNNERFAHHKRWTIEPDMLDSSFGHLYRALFSFAESSNAKQDLFLGLSPPARPEDGQKAFGIELRPIVQRAVEARDYFILWGPPGTGKTSVVLKELVEYYMARTNQRILLLAYTNRAVDEICAAIESIGPDMREQYVRIGSRISTGERYRNRLLRVLLEDTNKRRDVIEVLRGQRMIVATVSSVLSASDIMDILRPTTAIIDEASQLLEPMLASLLVRFDKSILIGDHKQLPAVVSQSPEQSKVNDDTLRQFGLNDTRTSYFERMFRLCESKGWDWAIGRLYKQGRMHEQIMDVANELFYDGALQILPADLSARDLTAPLESMRDGGTLSALCTERMLFIPSFVGEGELMSKTNDAEAAAVVAVLQALTECAPSRSIGVVTPFRAQIANIRDHVEEAGLDPDDYTIDTVERYQGSARDVIVLSVSVNHTTRLEQVISTTEEGIDRKLNVALTRAREQFVCIGVESVLRTSKTYSSLLDACTTLAMLTREKPVVS